ncbi:EVE domain-containing protein [Vibrio mangrovi]|uniref:UPF0310 protein SBX37_06510 n=1 Tax=Vibrio mangrovi TaxID=474394 RepID=A0A1Y6IWC6_9VIBR|nr:EVE domain-containing protein [Vibrio mangrovi]MDW6002513.1 EVE domain-containing protein [Vibrio mangrovi]SMS01957.1 hypothetical protein VIM7927_03268 [Vibrio mangrovi]
MSRYWIAVASADHVRNGREWGIMQVCHGKGSPLRRLSPGDGVVYYSPKQRFGYPEKCQAFTAVGQVLEGQPYQVDMGNGFLPYRRDVKWFEACQADIYPLLPVLHFHDGSRSWGAKFRYGLFEISQEDFETIAHAMMCQLPSPVQMMLFSGSGHEMS